jgi:DNA-binding MarR family transcriptional regulator
MTIKAEQMVTDRTALARSIQPLERDGLIAIGRGRIDRRSKELRLTDASAATLRAAMKAWSEAQARFESAFGVECAADMRALLRAVTASELQPGRVEPIVGERP